MCIHDDGVVESFVGCRWLSARWHSASAPPVPRPTLHTTSLPVAVASGWARVGMRCLSCKKLHYLAVVRTTRNTAFPDPALCTSVTRKPALRAASKNPISWVGVIHSTRTGPDALSTRPETWQP